MEKRVPKNLIIITSDEMRGDIPAYMGNPDCKTPNLDAFADKGIQFRNHFTVHGKCVPSRIAMVTGRYCHTDGYRSINHTNHIDADTPSLLDVLKDRGYETAVFGHNHKWADFYGDNSKGSGVTDYHSYTTDLFEPFTKLSHEVQQPGPDSVAVIENDKFCIEAERITDPISGFHDDNRALQVEHYLRQVRDKNRPFFMEIDFGMPHPAYKVEEPYFSMYDRDAITPFEYGLGENAPLPLKKMREIRGHDGTEAELRQLQAVYYGMCTKVDKNIGKVLQTIDDEGLWDDTVVIFTTDHGDFAGQYGLPEKWDTAMQDCILHVPFILWAPGLTGGKSVESLSEHVDITPTVLDLLGFSANWGIHGESMLPMIDGTRRKEAVFADGGHEDDMIARFNRPIRHTDKKGREVPSTHGKQEVYGRFPESMARTKMVRTEDWKLVIRLAGGNELYNMKEDPTEMSNLWGDPAYNQVVQDLQLRLIEWCLRTDTDRPYQEVVGA